MSFTILGIGTAVPPTRMSQAEAGEVARALCCRTREQETWLPLLYGNTGIDRRHLSLGRDLVVDVLQGTRHSGSVFLPTGEADDRGPTTGQRMAHYAEHAGPLALQAARQALANAGFPPEGITHLVTASCTGFRAPGVDVQLIQGLDLAPTVQRVHVGYMGCHGALNALRVADAFTGADAGAGVLVCATELCSLHYHYGWDPQKIIANAIFADGSAAVVGVAAAAAPGSAWRVRATGSCLCPDSEDAMTWTVGDHGFEMTLAKSVPTLIAAHLRPWLEGWLAKNGLGLDEVVSWAVHPGGPRILDAVEDALGLDREATAVAREVFAEYGNMSSPTVLFIIDRLRSYRAGLPCVALGFGPGLVAEAALFGP
jgi:predicted naringenin-chalcone synthase